MDEVELSFIGRSISHYRIVKRLGKGGMGVVYEAEDKNLGRLVALKFLPVNVARDPSALKRFQVEAQAAAALNHPNICTIHEIGEYDGQPFIAMELLEGQTLKQRLAAGSPTGAPLPVEQLLRLAVEIADALEAAHSNGIIHRDIKPSNIFITERGRAKILDFGLAKIVRPVESDAVTVDSLGQTQAGTVIGTVPYMAPEQLRGKPVDARADIYSFGVVLYEMATGRRPFPENQMSQLIASILTRAPQPPRQLNSRVSPGLEAIILKAVEKSPERRYQSAKEVSQDLGHVSLQGSVVGAFRLLATRRRALAALAAAALIAILAVLVGLNVAGLRGTLLAAVGAPHTALAPKIESVAVLPLENLSGDPGQDYFADGMTDELITKLAKIRALKVISRTSMMQYKGTKKPLTQIAKELHVDAVIEGSVLREGGQVRITAQLIDGKTDRNLWAESYQRDLRSVLALQDDVASAVASKIRAALTPAEQSSLASARPVNPEAYEAYLRGKFFLDKMTPEGFEKGLSYMQQAIRLDPNNPLPYAKLALAYCLMGHGEFPEVFSHASAAARKAIALGGGTLAETQLALGEIKLYRDFNVAAAGPYLQRALQLNPSLAEAHRQYSWYLNVIGRTEEALTEMRRAEETDPLSPLYPADLGFQYWMAGQYDRAMQEAHKSLEIDPNFGEALYLMANVYADQKMYDKAMAVARREVAAHPGDRWSLGLIEALVGRTDEALAVVAELEKDPTPRNAWGLALIYTSLGDRDQALRWLLAAYKSRYTIIPWMRAHPRFAPLRSDRRFQELASNVRFPQN